MKNYIQFIFLVSIVCSVFFCSCNKDLEQNPLSYSYIKTDVTCNGGNDGSIDIAISGGVEPYTYIWSNGSNSVNLNQLVAGSYIITITDGANGIIKDTITIFEPTVLNASLQIKEPSAEQADGEINLTVTGGTPPYNYNWSNGEITEDLQELSVGEYSISIEDANGCFIAQRIRLLGNVVDIDGNVYKTTVIGNQTWMAENLKTTKFSNGDIIPTTSPATLDISTEYEKSPKYQWAYDGNESNVDNYGRLYTWHTVADSRNVCPLGWHVPSDEEWNELINYIGNDGYKGQEGRVLKVVGWSEISEYDGTNIYDFSALPGGRREFNGLFEGIQYVYTPYYTWGYWWSTTESLRTNLDGSTWELGGVFHLGSDSKAITGGYEKFCGASVRCIKD